MKIKQKSAKKQVSGKLAAQKSEEAMIEGILEGSPEGIGVAVIRLDCGCKKMAAVDKNGDPASKVIIYRDLADSICPKCKEDNGAFMRVKEEFIHWVTPAPDEATMQMITEKVLGTRSTH
ncbi:MAG: hypothetical protein BM485_02895 [Desulfobulbaceae bacterium DB1]|nr:MAG: hypothetical protein BM485_02895 [Desulfobulbaceae bacterium DB1]